MSERFVIRYRGLEDPTREEKRRITATLKPFKVLDQMTGMFLVEGDERQVATALSQSPNWTVSRESSAGIAPPHKRVRRGP